MLRFFFAVASVARGEAVLPAGEGATWEYEVVRGCGSGAPPEHLTVRVAGQEQVGERSAVKLETLTAGELTKTEWIAVDPRGILCLRRTSTGGKDASFDPPQIVVPLPLKANFTWELDDSVLGTEMRQRWSVAGEEEVDVPAGKFKAFRLHCEQSWPLSISIDRWFTPGTGIVKEVTATHGPTGRLLNCLTRSLTKFSFAAMTPTPNLTLTSTPIPAPLAIDAPAQETLGTPALASPTRALRIRLEVTKDRDGPVVMAFKSDVPNIFVRWIGENLPVDSDARVAWIAEDVGDVAPPNFIVDQMVTTIARPEFGARFTLSRPRDGWAPGRYRVELYLEEELVGTVKVTIED